MPVRVILAEDSYLVREALRQLLEPDPALELVAIAEDAGALLAAIEEQAPDVVLTDIEMPPFEGGEGIHVAARLRDTHPAVGVVILSQYAEPGFALELLGAGSAGRAYLLKERVGNRAEITAAIHAVASGGSVVDPKIVEALIADRVRAEGSPVAALTTREREVLAEVATGKSNSAIAESLFLTKRAVEKHINAIFLKLGLRDSEDVSRRVKATLMYLAEDGPVSPAPSPPPRPTASAPGAEPS
jgi:DNA-binding NarL/FixJ family response regulator